MGPPSCILPCHAYLAPAFPRAALPLPAGLLTLAVSAGRVRCTPATGRSGAAATTATWSPTRRACPTRSCPARRSPTARGSTWRRPRERQVGRPARLADLRQPHRRRRPGLRRHQRRRHRRPDATSRPAAGWSSASTRPPASCSGSWSSPGWRPTIPNFNFDNLDLGVCSSPTVDGDRVYVVTNRGEVLCLDVARHGQRQRRAVPGRGPVHGRPGQAAGRRRARRRRHHLALRHDRRACRCWPHDAANCSILVHGDFALRVHLQRRGPVARPASRTRWPPA